MLGDALRRGRRARLGGVALVCSLAGIGGLAVGAHRAAAIRASAFTVQTSILPRGFITSLSVVRGYFPGVSRQASTGKNTTSSGKPAASRQVIYANASASIKVTLSVDQYASSREASSAFTQAEQKSRKVRGFSPLRVPKVGQRSSAGTVTQGKETHVGVAALQGGMIIQVTIAGFHATRANISKTVALTRREVATAERQCARKRGCTRR